jgi:hypothetical protein
MKFVISVIIIVGLWLGVSQFYHYWEKFKGKSPQADAPAQAEVSGDQLSGLPDKLQGPLQVAEEHGAPALREFLADHGQEIQDPRRAWIELDYIVLVGLSSPEEARRVFAQVKARLAPSSPVYDRMKQLEKTYE